MAIIRVRKLEKSFGKLEVLRGIDLDVEEKEKLVIIGPSGSGKSTLLRCLNLLEEPTGGSIEFAGVNITAPRARPQKSRGDWGGFSKP